MKKSIILTIVIVVALVIFISAKSQLSDLYGSNSGHRFADEKNSTFVIEKALVKLVDGKAIIEATPKSASQDTYRYFGNGASGDLNGDRIPEIAFLITKESGGSGLFYYVVVATQNKDGYEALNTIFIGDRIAPQSTQIQSGVLTINYADRKEGEPFTTAPSVGKSIRLKITDKKVEQI